jgi:hypothetical protein
MTITFEVSKVKLAAEPLPVMPIMEAVGQRCGKVEAAQTNVGWLFDTDIHPFVGAVHGAFASHYPLVLSPDDIWLCIAQGFATHVNLHAEALRDRFVRHQGKKTLTVRHDEFRRGDPSNDWPAVFRELSDQIAQHIGGQRNLVVANFSTTGPIERAASEVVLMAAMQEYFAYRALTLCGIPRITLLGTPADWAAIEDRVRVLGEYQLGWWTQALAPILAMIRKTAEGKPDVAAWQSFYKRGSASGVGETITGWINALFPYTVVQGTQQLSPNKNVADWSLDKTFDATPLSTIPNGLSVAPFTWSYLGTEIPMEFVAGFLAASYDAESRSLRPAIGWAVREAGAAPAPPPKSEWEF